MDTSIVYGMGFVMIAVGAIFLRMLFKGNEAKRPRDAVEWAGTILSLLLIVSAVVLMVMASEVDERANAQGQVATPEFFQDAIIEVPASNFSFNSVDDDRTFDLDDLKGNVIIINFWATWCGPCLDEIPDLNRLQKEFESEGLIVLSISDEDRGVLQAFQKRLALQTTSVYVPFGIDLPTPFTGAFVIRPSSFIVDRDGIVRRFLLGARNYDFFKKAVLPLLQS